jgi:hypothetical protein
MKKLLFFCCLSLLSIASFAQNAVYVEYDYFNPANTRIGYINSNNDTVFTNKKTIKVKGATPCTVRILNYNVDALQTTSMLRKGVNVDSVSNVNVLSFVNTFTSLVNPSIGINFSSLLPKSRGPQFKMAMADLHPDFAELQVNDNDQLSTLVKYDNLIRKKLTDINTWKLLLIQLNQLKFNTKLSAIDIKEQSVSLVAKLTIDAPVVLNDKIKSRIVVRQLARENADYLRYALVSFQKQVENDSVPSDNAKSKDGFEFAKENIKSYQKYINADTETEVLTVMDDIVSSYQAITNNPFETRMNLMIEDNIDLLQLNMYAINDKGQRISKEPIQSQPFFVKMPGRISIFNTVGVGLMKFNNALETYSLKGSTIVSTPADQVVPAFAFYMHFVGRGNGAAKFGGHFGVGVPLTENKSVNFQLGPTIVIGSQNAICINAGIVAGKVQRLGGGYKVGETYTSNTALPTINRYELGYQVGLSFNLAGLLKR